jgi:hypothetical protein
MFRIECPKSHFAAHPGAAITHKQPKARPLAATNAALGVGLKVMPWIPPWLKRLLAGGKTVTIDGNTLDPTLQLILTAQRTTRTGGLSADGDPENARALMRSSHAVMNTQIAVPTTDLTIPGPEGLTGPRQLVYGERESFLVGTGGSVAGGVGSPRIVCRSHRSRRNA